MGELNNILEKFTESNWDLISLPSKAYLDGITSKAELVKAIKQADEECGSCGCEFDPLYKKALELLIYTNKNEGIYQCFLHFLVINHFLYIYFNLISILLRSHTYNFFKDFCKIICIIKTC